MGAQLKHHLRSNIGHSLRTCGRISELDDVRVLCADLEGPRTCCPKDLLTSLLQNRQEFATSVLPTCHHHLIENSGSFCFRQIPPSKVFLSRETEGHVIDSKVDVF